MKRSEKIVLIGAGRVATQLGSAFKKAGVTILQVYSRTGPSARALAKKLSCKHTSQLKEISGEGDLYILAVNDDAIAELAKKLRLGSSTVVHTSGSVDMKILKNISSSYGVLYPLQTFSHPRATDISAVPFCIEASSAATEKKITLLVKKISQNIHRINSSERALLHLSAVFANNFSNYMYALSYAMLKKKNISFDLLHPLILETAAKAVSVDPLSAQTGPALRGDKKTIAKHLKMLRGNRNARRIYKLLSKSIRASAKK